MQISREPDNNPCLQHLKVPLRPPHSCLQDLTLPPHHPQSPLSHQNSPSPAMLSDLLSPILSPGVMSGDYIGVESCVDVLRDEDVPHCDYNQKNCYRRKVEDKREEKRLAMMKRKEIPPPIPMLARTENLPSHMPWVLKRHYTSDGRLILTEEKVRHHEYFRAHRSNGRLTLQLVPLDDEVLAPPFIANQKDDVDEAVTACDDDDNQEIEDNYSYENDDGNGGGEEEEDLREKEEEDEDADGVDDLQFHDGGPEEPISTLKCFNYNSVGTGSPCIFGVPVPAIRQVHS
ncbi:uncharacterized protein LOC126795883 [Argentina anserina]|uniref:uncharacterized protein LOC126795883 n=1 Tax=Argentina anserina TaxID=57926 RepID=UPI0021764A13|nr:uncharacterized protein LOC126795883 [Potentilla anserina]